jgi:acyl carrier protein
MVGMERAARMDIGGEIRKFISQNFLLRNGPDSLKDDDSLLEKGIIDSTGVLELVSFVEETFDIRVEDEELIPDNLDSINKLVLYVGRKLNRQTVG